MSRLADAGVPLSLVLVTEFSDIRSPDGLYRKYGVYIVGDRIIPRHLYFSNHWNVKDVRTGIPPEIDEASLFAEELEYLHGNPHEAELRPIFKRAGIGTAAWTIRCARTAASRSGRSTPTRCTWWWSYRRKSPLRRDLRAVQ